MGKWICKVCGYSHYGEEAPERCPQCGAMKSQFYQKGESKGCMLSLLAIIVVLSVSFFAFAGCGSSVTVDNTPVSEFDISRYMGKWYEIARYDHRFERGLTKCYAIYKLQKDGTVKVTNEGVKNGKWTKSVGKAKMTDATGVIRVSFFGPFYSDYRVLMLDSDYSYALVGGGSDDYLWILSRTPKLSEEIKSNILQEARSRGYNTDNLIWVKQ